MAPSHRTRVSFRRYVPAAAGIALLGATARALDGAPRPSRTPHASRIAPAPAAPLEADTLPHDPALRAGTLANGLRYYIRANHTPARRAFLRLVVNAGSVLEDEDQRGYAHFLEHMAFNGTRHFPRNSLIEYLERSGMRFGADINAYTAYDQTVYMLEVPTDDGKSLEQGLTMVHDWASGGMLIDSAEVLAERGVVLGEWRFRLPDTLSQHVQAHRDSVLYGDTRYATRSPIGLPHLLRTAEPEPIRRFYRDWYRPDLMAVVVVGDVDPHRVEREIRARFGGIAGPKHPRARVSPPLPSSDEPAVDVYRGMVPPAVTVLWKEVPHPMATRADFRDELVRTLLVQTLSERYLRLAERSHRPFAQASVGHVGIQRTASAMALTVVARPDSLTSGLAAALAELERVAQHGVPTARLERRKADLLASLAGDAASAGASTSDGFADRYTDNYLTKDASTLLSAEQRLALARELLPTIGPDDLASAAAFWRRRSNLLVQYDLFEWAHVRVPTREDVLQVFDSVAHERFPADSAAAAADEPLLAREPAPGRIVKEERDAASGVTTWTLSNGARVLFKPTTFDANELLIDARSPGGAALLPDSLFFGPGRLVAEMMTQAAGLGNAKAGSVQQQLVAKGLLRDFEVRLDPFEEGIRLGGSPSDLTTLFQLLYKQFTAPSLDTAALSAWRTLGTPGALPTDEQIDRMISPGERRLAPPSRALVQLADTGALMAVYRNRFGNAGDFTFTMVGAATAAQLKPLVERYVASLPSTGQHEQARDLGIEPLNGIQRESFPVFDVPKASLMLLYDGTFPSAPDTYLAARRRLDALEWVLRLRLNAMLRERLGGTYSVGVQGWTTAVPSEHYRLLVNFVAAPGRIEGMVDTMHTMLDAVRAAGATQYELRAIAAMRQRTRENLLQDDRYWLTTIELYDRLRIPFATIVAPPPGAVTAAEVRAAAREFLPTTDYFQRILMPEDSTLRAESDSTSERAQGATGAH
ncbi:MAG TPA: insulinase family protein [Gemmatimonadaceae bacterium]